MKIQNLKGAILATSIYSGGKQIGVNLTITLPEVTPETTEANAAGGTIELPVCSKIAAMETTISKQGIAPEWLQTLSHDPVELIANIVQQSVSPDGTSSVDHIKVFMRAALKNIPGIEASYGETSENELVFSVLSYRLTVNGRTYLHADPVNGIYKVNGKDYMGEIKSLL